jgi:hypothetical protein
MGLQPEFLTVSLSKLQGNKIIHNCYKSVTALIDMDKNYGLESCDVITVFICPKLSYGVMNLFFDYITLYL